MVGLAGGIARLEASPADLRISFILDIPLVMSESADARPGAIGTAEEIVDLQTITELFQGEEFPLTTGRVVLHGLDAAGSALCGRAADGLTPIEQRWDAGYLPHLPRCPRCSDPRADAGAGASGWPPAGLPATGVDVRTVHGSDSEKAGAEALLAVLAEHDLRRWMFTDLVTVDDDIRGGVSHPLTLNPRLLTQRPALAMTTFQHEQMHWLQGPGVDAATTEASQRWPDPPLLPTGGHDAQSTWLHVTVCGLEYLSLSEILGRADAEAELRQHRVYSWIYEQILADPEWLADLLARHDLHVPSEIPVPRRYYGPGWRESFPMK